jgi:hypothetical protein
MATAFPIPNEITKLSLGEVFQYILSDEWGMVPDLKASGDNCDNGDYRK